MYYKERSKKSYIELLSGPFQDYMDGICQHDNIIIVTDPPFNIGYHYGSYNDKLNDDDYYNMLVDLLKGFPTIYIHYPEALHRISLLSGIIPDRVCTWVYNSNTARQHRDIAYYKIKPDFKNVIQPYKNINDKRIQDRIARGIMGGRLYDWWNVNQVKNVSKDKTAHPCQMPVEIMKNSIGTLPNDCIIFDPFMGSGTTAIACIQLGYDFIGCEIDMNYYKIAEQRIYSEVLKYE